MPRAAAAGCSDRRRRRTYATIADGVTGDPPGTSGEEIVQPRRQRPLQRLVIGFASPPNRWRAARRTMGAGLRIVGAAPLPPACACAASGWSVDIGDQEFSPPTTRGCWFIMASSSRRFSRQLGFPIRERPAERQPRPGQAAHDRPDGDFQDLRGLSVAETLDRDQQQHRPLILRQQRHFPPYIRQIQPSIHLPHPIGGGQGSPKSAGSTLSFALHLLAAAAVDPAGSARCNSSSYPAAYRP